MTEAQKIADKLTDNPLILLAERVEGAERAERELDAAIARALGYIVCAEPARPSPRLYGNEVPRKNKRNLPRYTVSLDAAIDLVPEAFRFILDKRPFAKGRVDGYRADVWNAPAVEYGKAQAWACHPALALCAAALRARAAANPALPPDARPDYAGLGKGEVR